eukprot:m.52968 g.52968  ORF g.52968 m.52968 type:complete len:67 (-) comp7415_c1_seq2:147-347(-)
MPRRSKHTIDEFDGRDTELPTMGGTVDVSVPVTTGMPTVRVALPNGRYVECDVMATTRNTRDCGIP